MPRIGTKKRPIEEYEERVSPLEYYRDNTGSYGSLKFHLQGDATLGARRSNRIKPTIRRSSRLPSNAGVRPLEYCIPQPATNEPFERSRIKTREVNERTNERAKEQSEIAKVRILNTF